MELPQLIKTIVTQLFLLQNWHKLASLVCFSSLLLSKAIDLMGPIVLLIVVMNIVSTFRVYVKYIQHRYLTHLTLIVREIFKAHFKTMKVV